MTPERIAWFAGAGGIVVALLCWIIAPWSFPHAWLAALFCWMGWPLGSMALLLIHALTGGKWGYAIRPQLVAGLASLPLILPFVLPLLFVLPTLYPWLRPEEMPHLHNAFYLNPPFFAGRGIAYLIVWLALGGATIWALRRGEGTLQTIAGPALILLALTFGFASIDLTMSLDPDFKSSVYPMLEGTEAVLFALSIALLAVTRTQVSTPAVEDLGKLALALVIFWAYLDFMQVLIIWQSDLPDEAVWYVRRTSHGWQYAAGVIALLHFTLPFFLLLWPQLQRTRRALGLIAAALVAAEIVRAWWLVLPESKHGIGIADVAAMLGMFGLAVGVALRSPRVRVFDKAVRHG